MSKKNEDAPEAPPANPGSVTTEAAAATKIEKLTPAEWAERHGLVGKPNPVRPWDPAHKAPLYAAADALHGWSQDAHDYQGENDQLRITESDFKKALEAAGKYPAEPAHAPACGRAQAFQDRAKPVKDPRTGAVISGATQTVIVPKPPKGAVKTDG